MKALTTSDERGELALLEGGMWPTDEAGSLLQPVKAGGASVGGAGAAAHTDLVIVSWINVTLPSRARSLPSMFAP